MKKLLVPALSLLLPYSAWAQSELPDTTAAKELEEVVIEAPKVVHKADMDVYLPSSSAVENSKNGMQLLNNLMIPGLSVLDALGTISASGQDVQIRINGRQATVNELRNLLPETIKKVEWIDNPGLRYGGANYVLNVIVANPTLGGSLMLMAQPALTQAWGFYRADAKFNVGRSQWSVGGYGKLTEDVKIHRDYRETFTYPDGSTLARTEKPLGGSADNTFGGGWLNYSYVRPDTTIIYVGIDAYFKFSDRMHYHGLMSLDDGSPDIDLSDTQGSKGTTPAFSAYWEQHFAHRQTLVVDFRASLFNGHSYSDYVERRAGLTEPLTDVHTYIRDRNQAYGLEVDYIKNWSRSRFTAGASYTANRNRSEYRNLGGEIFHQRQDKAYVFAEYFQRLGRFTATAGVGAQYIDYLFRESGKGRHSWNVRPQATVTYSPNRNHNLRLSFTSWQSAPTLAQTNVAPQQLDGFQWQVGNPDLKTSNSYMLTLRYTFSLPRTYASFGIRAFTSPDAIAPYRYWDGDRLVTSYENTDGGLQNISFWLSPQVEVIPDWLMLSGTIQYRAERMKGTGYKLYNHCWSGDASVQVSHWGFTLQASYQRAQRDLWGETISYGEDINIIELNYNWKNWQFGAGCIMPVGRYDQGSRSLNRWNRNEQHMRMDMRIPYITVSWNLQWGRQKRSVNKLVNSDANVDSSKAAGR